MGELAAIVIAGGAARRFGGDKLSLRSQEGRSLLDVVVAGAAAHAQPVVVVGPDRELSVPVTWAREDPPGGGPGAALIAGLRHLPAHSRQVAVLAGDSPRGPLAIPALVAALGERGGAAATVVDSGGREQPITAVYDVEALRAAAAHHADGADMSVRRLLDDLRSSGVVGVADAWGAAEDIDVPDDAPRLGFG